MNAFLKYPREAIFMVDEHTLSLNDLIKRLRIKADMIQMGEGIAFGSDSEIMHEAATALELLESHHNEAHRRERITQPGIQQPSEISVVAAARCALENIKYALNNSRNADEALHTIGNEASWALSFYAGDESIRKDEQRVKPDCLADGLSPSPAPSPEPVSVTLTECFNALQAGKDDDWASGRVPLKPVRAILEYLKAKGVQFDVRD